MWPTRWRAVSSTRPTVIVSPSPTRTSVGTGMPSASSRPAYVRAPVAPTTSASACQWSPCRWVVTTDAMPPSPISVSRVSGSAAASISNCSPVARQRSRYALLFIVPTATLEIIRSVSSCTLAGPPTFTAPLYVMRLSL